MNHRCKHLTQFVLLHAEQMMKSNLEILRSTYINHKKPTPQKLLTSESQSRKTSISVHRYKYRSVLPPSFNESRKMPTQCNRQGEAKHIMRTMKNYKWTNINISGITQSIQNKNIPIL
jgi:hypothetical protein